MPDDHPRVDVSSRSAGWYRTYTCLTWKHSFGRNYHRFLKTMFQERVTSIALIPVILQSCWSIVLCSTCPISGNNQLIIFGGMSNRLSSPNPDDLCVLNDVRFFDLSSRHWLPAALSNGVLSDTGPESLVPRARYAHLASITADRLFIIGGQDFDNVWLDDICVYDLVAKVWVQRRNHARRCGTYRGVAISSNMCVRFPEEEREASQSVATLGPAGARFREDKIPPSSPEFTSPESLNRLPYSTLPTEDHPSDIYLYSNYNVRKLSSLFRFSPFSHLCLGIVYRCQTRARGHLPTSRIWFHGPRPIHCHVGCFFSTRSSIPLRSRSGDPFHNRGYLSRPHISIILYLGTRSSKPDMVSNRSW